MVLIAFSLQLFFLLWWMTLPGSARARARACVCKELSKVYISSSLFFSSPNNLEVASGPAPPLIDAGALPHARVVTLLRPAKRDSWLPPRQFRECSDLPVCYTSQSLIMAMTLSQRDECVDLEFKMHFGILIICFSLLPRIICTEWWFRLSKVFFSFLR